jgi:hypothetical protein
MTDYNALAQQAGAVSSQPAPVDYAALAKQNGAVSSTSPQSGNTGGAGGDWNADTSSAPPAPEHGLMGNIVSGIMKGVGGALSGAGGRVFEGAEGIKNVANDVLPASHQIPDIPKEYREETTTPEKIGGSATDALTYLAGEGELEGLAKATKIVDLADRFPVIAKTLELAKEHPVLSKLITATKAAGKGALVGGVQGGVEGAAEDQGKEGAEGGAAFGALGEVAGEAIKGITNSDLAKAFMNRASGVTKAMIRYGQDPAKALTEEKLPVFSTLTNRGRQAAAETKLNELKPALDTELQKSPATLNWKNVLGNTFANARTEIQDIEAMPDEAKAAAIQHIDAFEKNITQKWPTGDMSPFEMNELKSRIQKFGADYDSKPDATDLVRNLYSEAQGKLKDAVNSAVPGIKELNQRISNLVALKRAAAETVLAERAGIGPLSGFGTARKLEAAVGHAAPTVARASKAAPSVGGALGSQAGQELNTNSGNDRVTFLSSDGATHSVPVSQIEAARKIDPSLKVLDGASN